MGKRKIYFQPAEETGAGAAYMIEHGALENPKVDMIVGMHTFGLIETGKVVVREGPLMASVDVWNSL